MNKLPTKQIYLLAVAIIGIITLSVYSTYAIFTYESETGNVVSIHTPVSINLLFDSYEYKQISVPKDTYVTLDLDAYNNTNDELCYSVWYKTDTNLSNKINIFEKNENGLSTSGIIGPIANKRISLVVINDNDSDATIKIGLTYEKNSEKCSLNMSNDRQLVSTVVSNYEELAKSIIAKNEIVNSDAGYLTYKSITDVINLDSYQKVTIAKKFTLKDEVFTLVEPIDIELDSLKDTITNDTYYTCLTGNTCQSLYKINNILEETKTEVVDGKETEVKNINLNNYDLLVSYLAGNSGLRKIDNDYVYFGDNPHNFIYYNCQNDTDEKTCELWRIIGFYQDTQTGKYLTRIIRNSSIGLYEYDDDSNLWSNSEIAKYLEKEYKLTSNNKLVSINSKQENIIDDEISILTSESKSLITLINISDYLNASLCENKDLSEYDEVCFKNNWLNNNDAIDNLTMSITYQKPIVVDDEEEETEEEKPLNNTVYVVGNTFSAEPISEKFNVRPVLNLKSRVLLLSGNGTIDNPYIIK